MLVYIMNYDAATWCSETDEHTDIYVCVYIYIYI